MKTKPSTVPRLVRASRGPAFTLVEMLLVMVIISLLLAVSIPVTNSVLKANQISSAVQMTVDQLSLARQSALANNRVVEVRFYKFIRPEPGSDVEEVAAVETFIYDDTNLVATPLGEMQHFPNGAVISHDIMFSTLLLPTRERTTWTAQDPKRELPRGIGFNYKAYTFRFRPDGSTDLVTSGVNSNWFVTVHGAGNTGTPPPNYATIQLDPYNGSLRLYRPG